jgi:hypothetical protein
MNFVAQLGSLGNNQYPLWSLTAVALNVVVLYVLTARARAQRHPLTALLDRGPRTLADARLASITQLG